MTKKLEEMFELDTETTPNGMDEKLQEEQQTKDDKEADKGDE